MSTKLLIVESPKKSKTIEKYLGDDFIVRPTVGHINDLVKEGAYNLGIDVHDNFKLKYEILPDKVDKVRAIVSSAQMVDEILIASDPDREGEAIAFAVAEQLQHLNKPIKRVLFHEITKSGVKKGIDNPIELNDNLNQAQQARRALDRIVGFLVSSQLKAHYKKINSPVKPSAGRVQSVALRLIADREKEIRDFVPDVFYNINAVFSQGLIAKLTDKITNEEDAVKLIEILKNEEFKVHKLNSSVQKVQPLPPLTTSKLQRYASTRLKFSAEKTMKLAQSLYEKGHVTYIRTDSVRSSDESIKELRDYLVKKELSVSSKVNKYSTGDSAQDAHEAIRPTDVSKSPNRVLLDDEEAKLYEMIWNFFVASQMNPIEYNVTKIEIKAGKHIFKATGKILKSKGWSEILDDDSMKKDVVIPSMSKGDVLNVSTILHERRETKPNSRYNDGLLIEELEKKGIGRPSTFAAILSRITDKGYVAKRGNSYVPTELGMEVNELLCKFYSFMDLDYTRKMEESLDLIASGDITYLFVMEKFFSNLKNELNNAFLSDHEFTKHRCKVCNDNTILKSWSSGDYISCITCKYFERVDILNGEPVIIEEDKTPVPGINCHKCGDDMYERFGKYGKYYACVNRPRCKGSKRIDLPKKD